MNTEPVEIPMGIELDTYLYYISLTYVCYRQDFPGHAQVNAWCDAKSEPLLTYSTTVAS